MPITIVKKITIIIKDSYIGNGTNKKPETLSISKPNTASKVHITSRVSENTVKRWGRNG